ncbi:MAG: fimbrillin family protein [Bacteroidales bacterium]|nr:fimbrillin family protein [Candidatus Liminaster caballi]
MSEIPETRELPISFRNTEMVSQSNTRAVGLEERGVKDFYVWCYKTKSYDEGTKKYGDLQTIMDRYKVEWTENSAGTSASNSADWEYVGITDHDQRQNIKYWDTDATSYRFFGLAPADVSILRSFGPNDRNLSDATEYDFTFAADASKPEEAPYISALWISNNQPTALAPNIYGSTVVMEFMKPVTKVRILLVNEKGELIGDPLSEGITELNFGPIGGGDIVQKGNLKVSYPLQGATTFTQYLPTLTLVGDPAGSITMNRRNAIDDNPEVTDDYADWYYVLPHILQSSYQLTLTVYGSPRIATVPSEYMSWNPNMEYTYKFKLTATEVQLIDIVQIGVTAWTVENDNHDIYNW